ncbi:hypothetical protein Hanom_Chr15g01392181 [Helianthus anomalus]
MNDDSGGVLGGVPAKFKRCKCDFCGYSSKNFQDLNFCSIFLKQKMKKKFVIWYK